MSYCYRHLMLSCTSDFSLLSGHSDVHFDWCTVIGHANMILLWTWFHFDGHPVCLSYEQGLATQDFPLYSFSYKLPAQCHGYSSDTEWFVLILVSVNLPLLTSAPPNLVHSCPFCRFSHNPVDCAPTQREFLVFWKPLCLLGLRMNLLPWTWNPVLLAKSEASLPDQGVTGLCFYWAESLCGEIILLLWSYD